MPPVLLCESLVVFMFCDWAFATVSVSVERCLGCVGSSGVFNRGLAARHWQLVRGDGVSCGLARTELEEDGWLPEDPATMVFSDTPVASRTMFLSLPMPMLEADAQIRRWPLARVLPRSFRLGPYNTASKCKTLASRRTVTVAGSGPVGRVHTQDTGTEGQGALESIRDCE